MSAWLRIGTTNLLRQSRLRSVVLTEGEGERPSLLPSSKACGSIPERSALAWKRLIMKIQIAVWLTVGAVLITTIGMTVARLHRPAQIKVEVARDDPRSCFHILRTDDELRDAFRRSADCERRGAEILLARADRYAAQITPAPIAVIPIDGVTSTQVPPADYVHPQSA